MKRSFAIMLVLCLLLSLLPISAFATASEKNEPAVLTGGEIDTWVNPIYEDVLTPSDLIFSEKTESAEQNPEQDDRTIKNEQMLLNASGFMSTEEAGLQLRQYMLARRENITLKVSYSKNSKDAALEEVLNKAVEHTGKPTEGDYLLWHFAGWGGTYDVVNSGGVYNFTFELELSYLTTAAQESTVNRAVRNLLATLNVSKKSEYEKIKAVYDYICTNVTYDYTNLEDTSYQLKHSAYAALINKTAVCQGYATLMYRLLLELGVDSRVIAGELFTGDVHGWNIAKIGQVYYNLDATLDAEADPDVCFLRNSMLNYTHYRYLEYESTEFHRTYPVSETDYQEGVEGVPEYIFVAGTCGDDAYWTIDRDGKLTITGTGATYDYIDTWNLEFAAPWYYWKDGFDTVIVEEGITALGNYLFSSDGALGNVVSVTLPDSLTSIGMCTFRSCGNLTQIVIPDGVTTIGSSAFSGCSQLQSVKLGSGLEAIKNYAFSGCTSLSEIEFPDSLKTISGAAFENCNSLKEITVPAGVTYVDGFGSCKGLETAYVYGQTIGSYAFSYCPSLRKVVLTDALTSIQSCAFDYCSSLEEIIIPSSVVDIGMYTFRKCSALSVVYFEGSLPAIDDRAFDGVTATVYYPMNDETWTEEARQNYGGTLTWVATDHIHRYSVVVTAPTYTEQGYTTHTCSVCGDSYVDSYVDPLALPAANIQLARMILGNELAMQFAFKAAPIMEGVDYVVTITKTYADGRPDKVVVVPQSQWQSTSSGGQAYYFVSFNGIAAKEMGDEIYVQIMTADGTPAGDVYTNSVKNYAINQLRKTTDAKTRAVYVDMLNYGAAAQTYFGYDAENLVTAQLTETEKGYGTQSVVLENHLVKGPGYSASQLDLGSSILLRIRFGNIDSSMYAVIKFTNHMGRTIEARVEGTEFTHDGTVIVIDEVAAADYNQDVTVTVYDAEGNEVANAVESVASYLARQLDKPDALAIYDAVAKYCAAAYGYLHK